MTRRRLVLALVAATLALIGIAAWTWGEQLAVALFGPPRVELREVYERRPDGPRFDHSRLDRLLRAHAAASGLVDYAALQRDATELDRYLQQLAAADLDALGRDEKLALLINAYNACTLRLILDHWPVGSIRDIPSAQRWQAARWRIGDRTLSLHSIEHDYLRARFREPRIHFAINCASVSCPPLRAVAYTGHGIDAQLEQQTALVHADPRWLRLETDAVHLTRIYQWYAGDFEQVAGSVPDHAARYSAPLARAIASGRRPTVLWLPYDWSLNATEPPG